MNKGVAFLLFFAVITAFSGYSTAQSFDLAPRAGFYLEDTDIFIGGQADIELLDVVGLHFVPHIDFIFDEDTESKWLIGLNALYDAAPLVLGTFYVGGGIGFLRTKLDLSNFPGAQNVDEKDTESIISALAGVRFNLVRGMRPFANARISFGDDTAIVL